RRTHDGVPARRVERLHVRGGRVRPVVRVGPVAALRAAGPAERASGVPRARARGRVEPLCGARIVAVTVLWIVLGVLGLAVLAIAESYPDLKADGAFLSLQDELTNTEDRIQAARRFYNANVRSYNQRVESVPSNAIASLFGFRREAFFEVEPVVRERPPTTAL